MLFQKACFLDLAEVFDIHEGDLSFPRQLPGYARDLMASHGRIFGLIYASYLGEGAEEKTQKIVDSLPGSNLEVVVLGDDPEDNLWQLRRSYDLDFSRCVLFCQLNRPLEDLVRSVGVRFIRPVSMRRL
jgi:hypothetical protein